MRLMPQMRVRSGNVGHDLVIEHAPMGCMCTQENAWPEGGST